MDIPETRYAKTSDGVYIAYQVLGYGPVDLIYVPPRFSHLEQRWGEPRYARYLRRIAPFSRLIMFDKRGMGMSDPVAVEHPPDADTRMDDIRAVLDVVGSQLSSTRRRNRALSPCCSRRRIRTGPWHSSSTGPIRPAAPTSHGGTRSRSTKGNGLRSNEVGAPRTRCACGPQGWTLSSSGGGPPTCGMR